MLENTEVKTEKRKGVREMLTEYADEWVGEGVKLLKRLQLAVMLIAIGWMIFALGALALLAYVVIRSLGA